MRVLIVHHTWPGESTGGSEVYMAALASRLAARHEVTALYRVCDPTRPEYAVAERREGALRLFTLNNTLRDAGGFEAYRDPGAAAAIAGVLDTLRPEVVHVGHLAGLSTGAVFAARARGAAVVLTLHDFATLCPLGQLLTLDEAVCPGPAPERCLSCVGGQVLSPGSGSLRGLASLPLVPQAARLLARGSARGAARIAMRLDAMREVLRSADVRLAPSQFLARRFAELGVDDVDVLPYGHEPLPPRRLPVRAADGRVRVGFLGAAIPSKGVHVLAEAWRRIADPRVELAIHGPFVPYHGDTGYEQRVRAILGPDHAQVLRGPFAHAQRADVLAALDVLVVPSIWEENAPLVVDEARQAGVALVVSDHGGLAEQAARGGDALRFRAGDAGDLARVLRRLLDEPGLLARLRSAPAPVVTMDEHVPRVEEAYVRARQVFAERPGRVGAIVVDRARPDDAARAAASVLADGLPAQVLIVENGPGPESTVAAGVEVLRLPVNAGFAAGANAGLRRLRERGCDRLLVLNNDAVLEPGALRRLAEALADPGLAAVGPLVCRAGDGRIESRGVAFDAATGRSRLSGFGEAAGPEEGRIEVEALSGAALMLSGPALDRIGPLEEAYFHSFEDVDWSVRARQAGYRLAVVLGARARHAGGATLGAGSSDRLYYAVRSHLAAVKRLAPRSGIAGAARALAIVLRSLAHAVTQPDVPRGPALRAVLDGARDFRRGVSGARTPAS